MFIDTHYVQILFCASQFCRRKIETLFNVKGRNHLINRKFTRQTNKT